MADKIKKFFEKKKSEAKFKRAGPAHRLNEVRVTESSSSDFVVTAPSRVAPNAEAKQAAAAALARISEARSEGRAFNTSLGAIKAQVKKEIEDEKKAAEAAAAARLLDNESKPVVEELEASSPLLATSGVFFRCPLIGSEILPKEEWKPKIKEFLYAQLSEERGLTSCLIIHSCNKNRDKVEQCVDTLCTYLQNIIHNPGEEKYRKIRLSNRVFQERVSGLEGALDFLQAAGFVEESLLYQGSQEQFLVFPEDKVKDLESLEVLIDALRNAEGIGLELDRNLKVLLPSQAAKQVELPRAFFNMTLEEMKKEQQIRAQIAENTQVLRTKAMREKEELREMRKYKFVLIRIRFPEGVLLQGTFGVYERFKEVVEFVQDTLESSDTSFTLSTGTGIRLGDETYERSLIELHLVPATVLTFSWSTPPPHPKHSLKEDVMLLIQPI